MTVNITDLMGKSSNAAQSALGLRYAAPNQPPALNFLQPLVSASVQAKAAQEEVIAPVTEKSAADAINKTNTWAEDLYNRITGKKPASPPAPTGAPQ